MTLKRNAGHWIGGLSLLIALLLSGCLERKEKIVIAPDGSVKMEVTHRTDSKTDLYEGDAVPSMEGGWWAQEQTETDDKGKTTWVLKAELSLPLGAKLPSTYAALTEKDATQYLQFPTTLAVEQRSDGVYYHFRRVYQPRPWAQIDGPRRKVQEEIQKLGQKPAGELTHEDRLAIVRALTQVEVLKVMYFARQAFKDVTPNAPQDGWLALSASLGELVNQVDFERLARLIANKEQDPDNEELIQAEVKAFENQVMQRIRMSLSSAQGYAGSQIADFIRRYDWHKRYNEITEDLGDDGFEITVEMPGVLVGSNADSVNGTHLTWRFSGELVRDREIELMATSRVATR